MFEPDVNVLHDKRGYYVLMIAGKFEGNFDTVREAMMEAEEILSGGATI